MESRQFIKAVKALISRKDISLNQDQSEELRQEVQKEIDHLFQVLQNPTLPSAGKLRDWALENEFRVNNNTLHRLAQAESMWQ